MGVFSVLRGSRRRADGESHGETPAEPSPPRAAGARRRNAVVDAAAAAAILGDLKTLEQRYGAGIAPSAMRLRSAVLLHWTGRKSEAWAAFERLLADPALGGSAAVRPIMESEIYARMRMALEREGCHHAAITPAVLAYAKRAQFCERHGRHEELEVLRSDACFDRHFTPLLTRARLVSMLAALRALAQEYLQALAELDVAALEAALEGLRHDPPAAALPVRSRSGR